MRNTFVITAEPTFTRNLAYSIKICRIDSFLAQTVKACPFYFYFFYILDEDKSFKNIKSKKKTF